jgi:Flp pilus assembly protein TadB
MDTGNRNSMIAALVIMLGFGLFAYFLPTIMLAAAGISPVAGVAVVVAFIMCFFIVFWLRARSQNRKSD